MTQTAYLKRVLAAAVNAGWTIRALDNGGEETIQRDDWTPITVTREASEVGEAWIYLRHNERGEHGTLYVVWQGPLDDPHICGEEVICDYSMTLDEVVTSVTVD